MDGIAVVLAIALIAAPFAIIYNTINVRKLKRRHVHLSHLLQMLQYRLDDITGSQEPMPRESEESAERSPELSAAARVDVNIEATTPAAPDEPAPRPESTRPTIAPAAAEESAERDFASRWLIWLGGLTLALGGFFIVKYSIDEGLLNPPVRIVLGLITGGAMLAVGEWLRRTRPAFLADDDRYDYLPGTLSGAGLATIYGATYAAYGLYDMISPLEAYVVLAAISFGALALGLLHGPAIAGLGLIGAIIVPAIVSTGSQNAVALFSYLGIVVGANVLVSRIRMWWSITAIAIGLGYVWLLFWISVGDDALVLSLFNIALLIYAIAINLDEENSPFFDFGSATAGFSISSLAAAAAGFSSLLLLHHGYWAIDVTLVTCAIVAIFLGAALYRTQYYLMAAMASLLVVMSLASWPGSSSFWPDNAYQSNIAVDGQTYWLLAWAGAGLVAFAGIVGVLLKKPYSGYWASLSASVPVVALALSYIHWTGLEPALGWAGMALALSMALTLAAERTRDNVSALGAYATGAVAALSLALALYMRDAWLTVALAAQLPAIAYIYNRLNLDALRAIAGVIGAIVIIRLALNPSIFDYSVGSLPILNWVLYGYGLPALAFWAAARIFIARKDDLLVKILETGAIAFLTLLVTFEIRTLFNDSLDADYTNLLEISIESLAWLAISYGIYRRNLTGNRVVYRRASQILRWGGLAHLVLFQVLIFNPFRYHTDVGEWPLVNVLFLAYAAPAFVVALFIRAAIYRNDHRETWLMATASLGLIFIYLSTEVRRVFVGNFLDDAAISSAEQYTYSVVWILYGAALLGLAIWRHIPAFRYASLAVVMLATAKVFLFDMSGLTGLWRAGSFLGLGGALLAIGYIYQRYVFPSVPDNPEGKTVVNAP